MAALITWFVGLIARLGAWFMDNLFWRVVTAAGFTVAATTFSGNVFDGIFEKLMREVVSNFELLPDYLFQILAMAGMYDGMEIIVSAWLSVIGIRASINASKLSFKRLKPEA